MLQLQSIEQLDYTRFRHMVEAYWQEIMPDATVIQSAEQRLAYFQEQFPLGFNNHWIQWALVEKEPVGFVAVTVTPERKAAMIEDFYVRPTQRRKGVATAMVQALYRQFDQVGVELVELHVRRDSPQALAFWEAQGFRIALYRMRQYRDPQAGKAFVGALSSDFAAEGHHPQ